MTKEFELLVDKVAMRLANSKKPHKATLNKMYNYPVPAEYRLKRLDERYKHFKMLYDEQQAELERMFINAMSGKRNWETVGEPTTHNIKFG